MSPPPQYTADVSELALGRFEEVCQALGANALALAGVMFAESGWYAKAHNANGDASGIFQAMPSTLAGIGFRPDLAPAERAAAFRALSAADQVPWLRRYYAPYAGKLRSVAQCYVATFLPASLPQATNPDYVLAVANGFRGAVYAANAGFDRSHNLCIRVSDLTAAVARACVGPRWAELVSRLTDGCIQPVANVPVGFDTGSIPGLQGVLAALGYQPGAADGVYGPATRAAVVAFQAAQGLDPDGIVGPLTRQALKDAATAQGLVVQ